MKVTTNVNKISVERIKMRNMKLGQWGIIDDDDVLSYNGNVIFMQLDGVPYDFTHEGPHSDDCGIMVRLAKSVDIEIEI